MNEIISNSNNLDSGETLASSSFTFLDMLGLDADVKSRISVNLQSIVKGNSEVLTTPLAKSMSPEAILEGWDSIFNSKLEKMNSSLLEMEYANRDKYGPRSVAVPWKDRIPAISSYFGEDKCTVPSRFLFPQKYDLKLNLRPLTAAKAMEFLKNNTNSGLPYYTRKGRVKERTLVKFDELLARRDPCVLFTRTQEGNKTRNVWGYPMVDTLQETRYYRPVLNYQSKLPWRSALIGPEEVDRRITALIDYALKSGDVLISMDLSMFDATGKGKLQKGAFNYIKSMFQSQYHNDINNIAERFNSIGLITPDGITTGLHGVPSGSTFTNEVDSIIQFLVARSSGLVNWEHLQIQGDDGVYAMASEDVPEFFKHVEESGLIVSREKTRVSADQCTFLQMLHHVDYRQSNGVIGGIYSTYRALCRLVYQERWSDFEDFDLKGRDYYSLRAISILENCKFHPLFEDLVTYVKSIDKYSLRVSHGSVKKFVSLTKHGIGSRGEINNKYGDNPRGIKSFKTWRIVNS